MKFSGYLLNNHFELTEADSPVDLYRLWKCDGDPSMEELRCWVLLKTPDATTVWVEVVLNLPGYFDRIKSLLENEVSIEFRRKGSPSPNTSPHVSPSKESDSGTMETLQVEAESLQVSVSESFSTLGRRLSGTGTFSSTPKSVDLSELINDKEPFSMEEVQSIEDPIYLRFPKKKITGGEDILCVSLEYFQQFVEAEAASGKNLIDLKLNRIVCKDGRELNFVISKDVWMLSVLGSSQKMRHSFRDYLECSIMRENQLRQLKEDKDLWKRVRFWVADLLDFVSASERLTLPAADGICPFMSPYYFSPQEAKILGTLPMPNTTDLSTTMSIMLQEKATGGAVEICASHDIAPVLMVGFMIEKNFHKTESFKKEKKAWIKKQEKGHRLR